MPEKWEVDLLGDVEKSDMSSALVSSQQLVTTI
jgi:hypothetical protein